MIHIQEVGGSKPPCPTSKIKAYRDLGTDSQVVFGHTLGTVDKYKAVVTLINSGCT